MNPFNPNSHSLKERVNASLWNVYTNKSESHINRNAARRSLEASGVFPPLKTRIRLWWLRTLAAVRKGGGE